MIRIQNVIHFCNLTRFFRIENMHLCTHTVNTNVAIDQIPDNLHVMVDIGNAVIKVYIINVKTLSNWTNISLFTRNTYMYSHPASNHNSPD